MANSSFFREWYQPSNLKIARGRSKKQTVSHHLTKGYYVLFSLSINYEQLLGASDENIPCHDFVREMSILLLFFNQIYELVSSEWELAF